MKTFSAAKVILANAILAGHWHLRYQRINTTMQNKTLMKKMCYYFGETPG
jgi:hypothetical protein